MSGSTSRLALYLPGGGSTGSYGADEVADIDKLNSNFVKLDGMIYPSVGSMAELTALLPNVPNGALVPLRFYSNLSGSIAHCTSTWVKYAGSWALMPGTSIHVQGENNMGDLITAVTVITDYMNANSGAYFRYAGMRATSGAHIEARFHTSNTWIAWESGWITSFTPGVNGFSSAPTPWGRYRYTSGKVRFEFVFVANSASNGGVTLGLPVNASQTMTVGGTNTQSGTWATGRANVYVGGNDYDLAIAFVANFAIGFRIANATSRAIETVGNNVPVAWSSGASLRGVMEYDVF